MLPLHAFSTSALMVLQAVNIKRSSGCLILKTKSLLRYGVVIDRSILFLTDCRESTDPTLFLGFPLVGPFATFQSVDCNRHRLSLSSSFILVFVISLCRHHLLAWGVRECRHLCLSFCCVLPDLSHKPSRNRSNQPAVAHQRAPIFLVIIPFSSFQLLPSSFDSVRFLTPSHSWVFITLHLINNLFFFLFLFSTS